jgi:D-alanyl-D-alanine-carboxypeptidase/D-alanyl-D-alanine-endopeptidase
LRSTMNDMLIFARANLGVLSPSRQAAADVQRLQRLMQQTHTARASTGSDAAAIGMGWVLRKMGGREVLWHNGGTGGYRTWMGFDKTRKVAAIVLTNSSLANDDLGFTLVEGGPR